MGADSLTVLEAVFESTADGILIVDNSGKVLQANRRFQELWKISDELMALRDDEKLLKFIVDQLIDPEQFLSKVKDLYSNPMAISEDLIKFKDGSVFIRSSRPLDHLGRVWTFHDVTEQKRSEEVFKAITELSPDIISILSEEGTLVYNSPAAEKIHGYAPDELTGKNTFEFIHPEEKEACLAALQEIMTDPGKIVTVQYRYKNKNGVYLWMEATACNQISNSLIRGLVVISRVIESRKLLEQELSDALRSRDEFISIITHELKTPVTSIKLQLQMLKRSGRTLAHDDHKSRSENLPAMISQVNSLERLIDDLLHVSRVKNSKLTYDMKEIDLSTFIENSSDRFRDLLAEADCQVTVLVEPRVRCVCDQQRIEQVIVNLISNIIKYAPGRPVEISLVKRDGQVEFRIKDNGP
jgi:PAS domain S-box-containing protein